MSHVAMGSGPFKRKCGCGGLIKGEVSEGYQNYKAVCRILAGRTLR
jgi:hypothetical protein